jgi:aryl-alcohol dehydrogenase-like predicted oxidoreductase
MQYRALGRTGVQVSPFCLGAMLFGGSTPEDEAITLVDTALAAGINFIDTANVYVRGRSEEVLGKALARDGKRAGVVLATKAHGRMRDGDPNARGNHRRHLIEQCHESLRRLNTDYIDLYYLHRPQADVPIDETLRALDDLIRQGKILYIGCSTFATWATMEALWTSDKHHLNRFIAEQPPYHLLERGPELELFPMAQTYGMAIMPWSPLAGGLLTGKYQRDNNPTDARLRQGSGPWTDKHFEPQVLEVVAALGAFAKEKGCTLTQLALAWNSAQPAVTSPILGARTLVQLEEQLGALNVTLSAEDMARIDQIAPPHNQLVPYFRMDSYTDFRPHLHRL